MLSVEPVMEQDTIGIQLIQDRISVLLMAGREYYYLPLLTDSFQESEHVRSDCDFHTNRHALDLNVEPKVRLAL